MIEKLTRVPLREVWKDEARDFTSWLEQNIDVLNDILDITLTSAEKEQSAGNFNVDLVAEDETGNQVVIENQLEKSNHDHLGKLITYLTNTDAKVGIWIVREPRQEHVTAISWLNEATSASFYLVKVEAVKIGISAPAPLFTLIVGPTEEGRLVGEKKMQLATRHIQRQKFWAELLTEAKTKTKLHASISPTKYSWIGTGAGRRGLGYNYTITRHGAAVELYIDRGKETTEENKQIFDKLYKKKAEIEEIFGEPLNWQRLDERRACRISRSFENVGYLDEEGWPELIEDMIKKMIQLEKAFKSHIAKLGIQE
ncbi:DUF4268 domain-containing protein [bacterium]|nr:DUF4268 domain-containing protein [bacterium]